MYHIFWIGLNRKPLYNLILDFVWYVKNYGFIFSMSLVPGFIVGYVWRTLEHVHSFVSITHISCFFFIIIFYYMDIAMYYMINKTFSLFYRDNSDLFCYFFYRTYMFLYYLHKTYHYNSAPQKKWCTTTNVLFDTKLCQK